ncbi:MAG: hypothetical protein KDA74_12780 [Planctomycetaceae bacterium]|nr:hypothetical protein [Planctomycetaceae bacterium]
MMQGVPLINEWWHIFLIMQFRFVLFLVVGQSEDALRLKALFQKRADGILKSN